MTAYPFDTTPEALDGDLETYIDAVFACLESEFLVMPKGNGFVDYPIFEHGYERLKTISQSFSRLDPAAVLAATQVEPIILIVLRTMLGFTPPEWAYVTSQRTGMDVPQGFLRSLDRKIRMNSTLRLRASGQTLARLQAVIATACDLLTEGKPAVAVDQLHRFDKADTQDGLASLVNLANLGVPYAMLLYERFLGRPFAGHRDSVSDLIGDALESAIENVLQAAGISFRKTKRAEKIPGFDQTPDFIIPSEFNPKVVIEAKITEDDGTARDKVTRIQHLGQLSRVGVKPDAPAKFEVIACIGGRGFGVRREDMRKMLLATGGKVFTLKTLTRLVDATRLCEFRTRTG